MGWDGGVGCGGVAGKRRRRGEKEELVEGDRKKEKRRERERVGAGDRTKTEKIGKISIRTFRITGTPSDLEQRCSV